MKRLVVCLAAGLFSLAVSAMELGDAKPPTQQQLQQLLTGNTIQGEWDGRPFTWPAYLTNFLLRTPQSALWHTVLPAAR